MQQPVVPGTLSRYARRLLPVLDGLLRPGGPGVPSLWAQPLRRAAQAAACLATSSDGASPADVAALDAVAGLLERPGTAVCQGRLAPLRGGPGVLELFQPAVEERTRSVGRLDVQGGGAPHPLGSAALVGEALVLTTRRIALQAGRAGAGGWQPCPDGAPTVDFACELGGAAERVPLVAGGAVHPRQDLALLRLAWTPPDRRPLRLASQLPDGLLGCTVFAVGHPAERAQAVKRLEAGRVTGRLPAGQFQHDCRGIGAEPGAAVIDLETGLAVGLQQGVPGRALALWPLDQDPHLPTGAITFL